VKLISQFTQLDAFIRPSPTRSCIPLLLLTCHYLAYRNIGLPVTFFSSGQVIAMQESYSKSYCNYVYHLLSIKKLNFYTECITYLLCFLQWTTITSLNSF